MWKWKWDKLWGYSDQISSMLIIFQNCPEQFGLSSVIDFLCGAINTLGEKMLWMIVLSSMDMHHDKLNGKKGRPKLQIRGDMLEYYVDSVYFDPDGNYSRSVHINSSKKTLGNKYFNFL